MFAIVVLGMHRSGTSCLAGMLAAGGAASAGEAVRNWDNARGHHEMLDVIRLNEAVLAHSGGHWMAPPATLRWTDDHAAERDRLLTSRIDGRPALLKDPRMLLALPFWRASRVPYHVIGIVRHPLAVARSLEAWRELPIAEGVALWTAHNRALVEDRARHGYAVIDFDEPAASVIAAVVAACAELGIAIDEARLAGAYDERLVHHDPGDVPTGLDDAIALHHQLVTRHAPQRPAFPRDELAAFARWLREGTISEAIERARAALAAVSDPAAVLVPVVTALVRRHALAEARALIAEHAARLEEGVADLLHGKVLLAMDDAASAVPHLEAARAVAHPYFQARHLLAVALRGAGRTADARVAMQDLANGALYPHNPLATLAEWSWLDGDHAAALAEIERAITAAPLRRRGRLRCRRAEWLVVCGDRIGARAELELALAEDPGYARSRELLTNL